MRIDEVEPRLRSPVSEETRLDVLGLEGLAQQSVVSEVELCRADKVRGAEMGVDVVEAFFRRSNVSSNI
jgi:hypothetical protein